MATATKKAPAKKAAPEQQAAPAAKKKAAAVAAPVQETPAAEAPAKRANAAFMKPLTPSKELAAVVGATPLPRTAVVSALWVYIKKHDLQDPANKRMINADAKLKKIFDKKQVSMFEMAGLIGKHLS